jgi:hypothetical protein
MATFAGIVPATAFLRFRLAAASALRPRRSMGNRAPRLLEPHVMFGAGLVRVAILPQEGWV